MATSGSRFVHALAVLLVVPIIACRPVYAQVDSTTAQMFFHHEPWPLPPGNTVLTTGLLLTLLPEPVVENEVPTPALQFQVRHGLGTNLSGIVTLSTNVVTNLLQAGVQWNRESDGTSFAIGTNLVGFVGWLSDDGYFEDAWAVAFGTIPFLRVGHRFEGFSLSAMAAASIVVFGESHLGTHEAPGLSDGIVVNDIYATLAIEQPFLDNSAVSVGVILTYSRTPYQSWILFSTFDQYLLIPEFFVGFQL